MKRLHRPERSCLGCGRRDRADRMIRLVLGDDGFLRIRRSGEGRGGYIHPARECGDAFIKRKKVYRAFRAEVSRDARARLVETLLNPELR